MTCTPDKTVLADGTPPVNIKTEATQFYERGMIDMKKKMAIVLSLVLACSMSMTAFAAPSPSLNTGNTPVSQVTVDQSVGTAESTVSGVASATSAVAVGTTFATAKGNQALDAASVQLVVAPTTVAETTTSASELTKALTAKKVKIINKSGEKNISLLNREGKVKYLCSRNVYLTNSKGELVASKGSISIAKSLKEILGGYQLAENETIRAMYKRADGTFVALPVVIKGDVVSFALPSISGVVEVVFTAAVGTRQETLQSEKAPKL